MSAPLSGSAGGSPAPGFYPDPSIPGYIRYWNGSSWVPGTSRPEPQEGEAMPTPPSAAAASSAVAPPTREEPAPAEETGPVFLDEEMDSGAGPESQLPAARSGDSPLPEVRPRGEVATAGSIDWDDPSRLHGQRPEPASAWQADAAQQAGFAGQSEERVSWGLGEGGEGAAGAPGAAADPRGGWGSPVAEGGPQGRTDSGVAPSQASPASPAHGAGSAGSPPRDGTFQMRALSPEARGQAGQEPPGAEGAVPGQQAPEHTVGLRRSDVLRHGTGAQTPPAAATPSAPAVPGQGSPAQPQMPAQGAPPQNPQAAPPQAPPAAPQQGAPPQQGVPPQHGVPHQQGVPPQHGAPQGAVPGPGPAQPSWAQQVHDLAGNAPGGGQDAHAAPGAEAAMAWRPPSADPFAQAQQEARPAGLGKRFGARMVDGLITGAVAAAVAFPFVGESVAHVQAKIQAVRDAGETKTVWLIDGTTGSHLAVVLGVLLLFGLLYEVLPTARWGRTLGKKLFGLRVLTMEQQDKPGFAGALKRWLTYGVLSLLVIGVANVLWCLFDRPWRQCWHDKLANTFVSKDSGEIRL